jgi:RNA polymerase sigma-70 factor (ECF subfamily)
MEAEEVLQETFINACRGVENFEKRSSLGTWLYRIATNNGLMRLRRRKTPTVPLNGSPDQEEDHFWPHHLEDWEWEPESLTLSDELQHVMDKAVAALPETLQPVFILRDLEGFSTKQTAEILDISTNNVKVRLHRARLMLREQLAAYFDEKTNGSGETR